MAAPVTVFDDGLKKLVADMAETMYAAPGIGLAATQVDVHKQIIVVDVSERRDSLVVLVNPEIVEATGVSDIEEGCLSVPGIYEMVERAERVKVRAFDQNGNAVHARSARPARRVHPARDGSPEGQGVRRVPVAAEAAAHPRKARQAAAQVRLTSPSCASSSPARPSSPRAALARAARRRPRHRARPDAARPACRPRLAAAPAR